MADVGPSLISIGLTGPWSSLGSLFPLQRSGMQPERWDAARQA